MFECTETTESIYEGVVEPSYKKPTRSDANHKGHSRKMRGGSTLLTTYSEMSDIYGKCRKRYVDRLKDISKLTCHIHVPGHS